MEVNESFTLCVVSATQWRRAQVTLVFRSADESARRAIQGDLLFGPAENLFPPAGFEQREVHRQKRFQSSGKNRRVAHDLPGLRPAIALAG